ncbi:hypothetical protein WN48_09014 [Eufriesea mexicana]|uniref:uncharacterized protein LOC108546029 n=1 Tax=Eufriesea mexicana TaxID=516756 RepID=UPI00083BC72A|nr:PREDICTED: uncharacterized protein LOC108546029 [Eufriesea mexicana]OAD59492.1 hypothetical protein WN48_09014 [Eufriesea mexicana]
MTSIFSREKFRMVNRRSPEIQLIDEWKPVREVWSLRYGDKIIGGIAAVNAVLINQMFRRKLKLRHEGAIFTTLSLAFGSGIATQIGHKYFVTEDIMKYRRKCVMCQELKATLSCCGTGILHPLILAPLINIAIAGTIGYRIPYLYEVKELTTFCWSVVRPQFKILSFLLFTNIFVSAIITYSEISLMERVVDIVLNFQELYPEDSGKIRDYDTVTGKLFK